MTCSLQTDVLLPGPDEIIALALAALSVEGVGAVLRAPVLTPAPALLVLLYLHLLPPLLLISALQVRFYHHLHSLLPDLQ